MKRRWLWLAAAAFWWPVALGWAAENSSSATDLNNQAITEAQAGHLQKAVALMRQAFGRAPQDPQIRDNLSLALTDQALESQKAGKAEESLALFMEALGVNPQNGYAWMHLGNLYYLEKSDFSQAVSSWEKAQGLIPAEQWRGLVDRIAQAQRDQNIERRFTVHPSVHFQIRFSGPEHQHVVVRLADRLEQEYTRLSQELGVSPARFSVILYEKGDFQRLRGRPDWALGLYDGRIRVRIEDLETRREDWILPHELAHAFLHEGYGGRIPTWVHEGYAQLQEPPSTLSADQQSMLERVTSGSLWIPLQWLDAHFDKPSGSDDVERAYTQARVVVDFLRRKYGMGRFREFLSRLSQGRPVEEAFDQSFAPERWSRVSKGILK